MRSDVEIALAHVAYPIAEFQDAAEIRAACILGYLSATEAADLAIGLVGAEAPVDVAQVFEGLIEGRGRHVLVADVEADGRAHDLLDTTQSE